MKKALILLTSFLLLSFGTAYAFPLFYGTPDQPGTKFEDNNLEYFIDNDEDGLISFGDYIYSAFEFDRIVDNSGGGSPAYDLDESIDELVGIARIQYLANDPVTNRWIFGQIDDTPMVEVYTSGGGNDFISDSPGTDPDWDTALAYITEGQFLWSFSIDPLDPDTFWQFTPIDPNANDPAELLTIASGTTVGVVNFQLNQIGGTPIWQPITGLSGTPGDEMTDIRGSGTIETNTGLTGGAFAVSDIQVFGNPIPEPATMVLFGLGLLSLAAVGRKQKN